VSKWQQTASNNLLTAQLATYFVRAAHAIISFDKRIIAQCVSHYFTQPTDAAILQYHPTLQVLLQREDGSLRSRWPTCIDMNLLLHPGRKRSILMNNWTCLTVCLCICVFASISPKLNIRSSSNFCAWSFTLHTCVMYFRLWDWVCGISQRTIANSDETTHFLQHQHVTVTFDLVNSSAKQMIKFWTLWLTCSYEFNRYVSTDIDTT